MTCARNDRGVSRRSVSNRRVPVFTRVTSILLDHIIDVNMRNCATSNCAFLDKKLGFQSSKRLDVRHSMCPVNDTLICISIFERRYIVQWILKLRKN